MGIRQQTGKPSARTALEVAALPFVLLCNHLATASISLSLHLSSSSSLSSTSVIQDDLQISSGEQCSSGQAEQLENVVCAEDTNAGESQENACGGGVWVHRRSMHTRQKRHWIGGSASCPGTHNEANV
ncbi:uncharacterized protein MONOS_16328 [Monocercomonoides exilis]|uniref:uncharacterized protein n=1 Tax=Monocercomonoides exilis TaxID=2049356 RepID=UPI00355A3582|nr:hypothetical protein MONOS_16328 [Monocercomonoides exilis]|eukprot:MONOS_16328.1-p1 / transcript=MONOS_16328.1 / gene=MONOS_16328 / organism=Monocercomonoides_exilis_PA203 / gene_product=unspecified product / transcript_product=unspecified product / location=Mono_scaffold01652:480-916(-) / protein_length=128 / sequence_SO=supercontig / SO=protein_coding / is_pseudo=false